MAIAALVLLIVVIGPCVAWLIWTFGTGRDIARVCESCGRGADVRLKDGSTWCVGCHAAALNLGYDDEHGRAI